MTQRRTTIKDIAREVGVSAQTVSRVINDAPDVSPETRSRVQQVIARLGYHPNLIARNLIKQQSQTIGVMVSSLEYTGPHLVLAGIEQQASVLGYSLVLQILDMSAGGNFDNQVRQLLGHQVCGIIWLVPEFRHNYDWWHTQTMHKNFPIVFMNCRPYPGFNVVEVDDHYGGYLATRHLLEQGFRKIAILTGPQDGWESDQRLGGWRRALAEYGIIPEDRQIVKGDWNPESGAEGLKLLTRQYPEMDAVFACSDYMALGAMYAARDLNIKIPEQLAVVGFDDWIETRFYRPSLTTIHKPFVEIGKLSVRELHRMVEMHRAGLPMENQVIQIQPNLVVRESTRALTPAPQP